MTMHFKQEILGNFEENLYIFHVQKSNNLIFVSCNFFYLAQHEKPIASSPLNIYKNIH
jgi:hypothetical protein